MKKIYLSLITVLLIALTVVSCRQDDELKGNVGYLRIEVGTNAYVDTRSIPEDYNPKQIALQILNSSNEVVEETDDWQELKGQQLRLTPGTYTIKASSNGFDGSESGFDIPYYAGSQQVTIESGKEKTANITCTLANVKVTVNYDESFQKFASATTTVTSELEGVAALDFTMGKELKPGYFPVGNLNVTVKVTNQAGQSNQKTTEITEVKARKHYILNFKVAESGINKPTVTINGEEITYTFQFNVATEATTQLEAESANAWSNFAYVEGKVLSAESELDAAAMRFEYKKADASEWTTVAATHATDTYKATLTNLTPATTYTYRMVYEKEEENYTSNEVSFTTEAAIELPNGNMDDWYQASGVWYATSETEYSSMGPFWDSGNEGGSMMGKNPTQGNSTTVHTANGKSAELKSQYIGVTSSLGKFAAGNLYAGAFGELQGMDGASIYFGQEFASRPKSLHGWFNYTSGKIDYRGEKTPEGEGLKGNDDLCSIYIAIAKERILVDNTDISTFPNWETDERIIAYDRLSDAEAGNTQGWKEFTLDFKYRNIEPQNKYYLIIVFSASKYGDYFTGSTSSVMYVDDLELVYGEPVTE
ncbi:DUF4493 domain-containing protein [Phocaeicola barnesiae]|uniref:DUF4493 domain-containing protein n=1 Tax=Phocaeicola barnesiae TaxID=376804 RepID=UPI0025A3D8AE|nr:DUF4493 domain-containing protein [Phocaeicola barnesiae]MDM8256440.1 PCMD domain-containing protein [Phocaeicola barnesiae]